MLQCDAGVTQLLHKKIGEHNASVTSVTYNIIIYSKERDRPTFPYLLMKTPKPCNSVTLEPTSSETPNVTLMSQGCNRRWIE